MPLLIRDEEPVFHLDPDDMLASFEGRLSEIYLTVVLAMMLIYDCREC